MNDIFYRHPDVFAVGETAPIIFECSNGLEIGLQSCRERIVNGEILELRPRTVDAVRRLMCEEFPSTESHWMHKPIGLSACVEAKMVSRGVDYAADWYWGIFSDLFPQSRDILVLRDPIDTIASGARYWQRSEASVAYELSLTLKILSRTTLRPLVIRFDELANHPQDSLRRLLAHAEVDYRDECLESFNFKHSSYVGSFGKMIPEDRSAAEDFKYKSQKLAVEDAVGSGSMGEIYKLYDDIFEKLS